MKLEYIQTLMHRVKLKPTDPYLTSNDHQELECLLCNGKFIATPKSKFSNFKKHGHVGCPECVRIKNNSDARLANIETITKMGYIILEDVTLNKVSRRTKIKVTNSNCKCGRSWNAEISHILSGRAFCRPCNDDRKRNRFNVQNEIRRKKFDGSYETYRANVRRLTEQNYKAHIQTINPNGYTRALSGTDNGYHLDHIVPLVIAYRVGIPPEECAAPYNLRMLEWKKNANKWSKPPSAIPQPLIKYFGNKSILTDKVIDFFKSNKIEFTDNRADSDLDCDFNISNDLAIKIVDFDSHFDRNLKTKTYLSVLRSKLYTKFNKVFIIFQNEILDPVLWEIVKSRILNAIRHDNVIKLFARKTQVKIIDSKTHNKFMAENHIQGATNASHRYGLYDGDRLVAVMSFAKPRVLMNNINRDPESYEIIRYATLRGYNVVGGASKLFSAFVKDMGSDVKIFSFADLRWGNGDLYSSLGLNHVSTSRPNYWYIIDEKPVHRYRYAKHNLKKLFPDTFSPDKTEYEIMVENGLDRVWDCGSKLFQNY